MPEEEPWASPGRERRQEVHHATSQPDKLLKLPVHPKGACDTLRLVC